MFMQNYGRYFSELSKTRAGDVVQFVA